MNVKIKIGLVPALTVSVVDALLFGTTDLFCEMLVFIPSLLATISAIYLLLSRPQCLNCSDKRINIIIWLVAILVALISTTLVRYFVFTTITHK
jgi:flagellar biosynthesis protein FliQ